MECTCSHDMYVTLAVIMFGFDLTAINGASKIQQELNCEFMDSKWFCWYDSRPDKIRLKDFEQRMMIYVRIRVTLRK